MTGPDAVSEALLAGEVPPGAYRWGPGTAHVGALVAGAADAGWAVARLDGARVRTVDDLHDALAVSLALPAHYGRNLDALHDCVADLPTPGLLVWDGWGGFAREHPRTTRLALQVLGERLVVLVTGPGPDDEVPLPGLG